MITAKRGKEIKSRNSSHCRVLKYAGKEEYDVLDWDQERRIEVEVDRCEPRLLCGKLFTGTLSHTKEKGGGVVSRPPIVFRPHETRLEDSNYYGLW